MTLPKQTPWKHILLLAGLFTLADQLSKWLVQNQELNYTQNTGIAFGIAIPNTAAITVTIILIPLIAYIANKELNLKNKLSQLCLALVLGGALGNLIDRIVHGYVIDFISVWKWPDFNLADSFVTFGILLTIWFYASMRQVKSSRK